MTCQPNSRDSSTDRRKSFHVFMSQDSRRRGGITTFLNCEKQKRYEVFRADNYSPQVCEPVLLCRPKFSRFATSWRLFRPTRRAVCALSVPTACYGCGCRDASQDGANVCASFNRQQ